MKQLVKNLIAYVNISDFFVNKVKLEQEKYFDDKKFTNSNLFNDPLILVTENTNKENTIYVKWDFCKKNIKKVMEILRETDKESIWLSSKKIVRNSVLNSILKNDNIKNVGVTSSKGLSNRQINKLINNGIENLICTPSYNEANKLLKYYKKGMCINNFIVFNSGAAFEGFGGEEVSLVMLRALTIEDLDLLKKIFNKFPQKEVVVDFVNLTQIKEIIEAIKCDKLYVRNNEDLKKEHYEILGESSSNIFVKTLDNLLVPPKYLKHKEEIIELIIKEVRSKDLSSFEKYMYLYNIVKFYKEYKEVPTGTELLEARKCEFTLFNDYMVCVGYTNLLEELVNRLDDPNIRIAEYGCKLVSKNGEVLNHSRCIVRIKDESYDINGTYISDPTWDSVNYYGNYRDENGKIVVCEDESIANIDYYNYFLLTFDEAKDLRGKRTTKDATDVFFSKCKITDKNSFEVYEITKKFRKSEDATSEEVSLEIENTVQSKISAEKIKRAITKIYSLTFANDDETIQKMVDCTIQHNDIEQVLQFNKTKSKFKSLLRKKQLFN